MIGHRRIVRLLSRSVSRYSLPPSLIFAGPAGVGKRLAATAVAQSFNCLQPNVEPGTLNTEPRTPNPERRTWNPEPGTSNQEFDACGTCSACTRIARGVHPDVLVLEPGDNGSIKIEQVREVIDRAAYRPFEGKRRVVIVDGADALALQLHRTPC